MCSISTFYGRKSDAHSWWCAQYGYVSSVLHPCQLASNLCADKSKILLAGNVDWGVSLANDGFAFWLGECLDTRLLSVRVVMPAVCLRGRTDDNLGVKRSDARIRLWLRRCCKWCGQLHWHGWPNHLHPVATGCDRCGDLLSPEHLRW